MSKVDRIRMRISKLLFSCLLLLIFAHCQNTAQGAPGQSQGESTVDPTARPQVISTYPADNDSEVNPLVSIQVRFDRPMASASIFGQSAAGSCTGSIQISSDNFANCVGVDAVVLSPGDMNAGVRLKEPLAHGTVFKLRITSAVKSAFGVSAAAAYTQVHGFLTESRNGSVDQSFNFGFANDVQGINGPVNVAALQSDGRIIVGGSFHAVGAHVRYGLARLLSDGTLDPSFESGLPSNADVKALQIQPDGKILAAGAFSTYAGSVRPGIVRLNPNGLLDYGFNPGSGINTQVLGLGLQQDGKILICGEFTVYNGVVRNRIARLNQDGSLDMAFNPGTGADATIYSLAVQSDGKILIAGNFTSYNGITRNSIARLNTNGSVDLSFDPGAGADSGIVALSIQADGKVLIGGFFQNYQSIGRNYVARINADGSLDSDFNPGIGPNSSVSGLTQASDGKVLIVGSFTTFNGVSRKFVARIFGNGTLDGSFDPGTGADTGVAGGILLPDGHMILWGGFSTFSGHRQRALARLTGSGLLEPTLGATTTGPNASVAAVAPQADGNILIGGSFTEYNGTSRNRIARIKPDGSLDMTFDAQSGGNDAVTAIAIQPSGEIVVGGAFAQFAGVSRNRIARLNANGSLDTTFNPGATMGFDDIIGGISVHSNGNMIIYGSFTGGYHLTDANGTELGGEVINGSIRSAVYQADGKILLGGNFQLVDYPARKGLVRLLTDGTLDASFDITSLGNVNDIFSVIVQPDAKIIIGGAFGTSIGATRDRIARLNADGSLDTTFPAPPQMWTYGPIARLFLQPDGKIIVQGYDLRRLHSDGGWDLTIPFGSVAMQGVNTAAMLPGGKLAFGGSFTYFKNIGRNYLALFSL